MWKNILQYVISVGFLLPQMFKRSAIRSGAECFGLVALATLGSEFSSQARPRQAHQKGMLDRGP